MFDADFIARFGLERLATPGRHGVADGRPGVVISHRTNFAIAAIMARKGNEDALTQRVRKEFALDLPVKPRRIDSDSIAFVWAGPGHWLGIAQEPAGRFEAELRMKLAGLASVVDQTDARTIVRISGTSARAMLAKGVPIDLHPRVFGPGDAALTAVAYIGVHFWQRDDTPTYEFAMFRSFAGSFWRWLNSAGAEYGIAIADQNANA